MKGQTAYITYTGLEEIFTFEDDYPELYRILLFHSDVMVDLPDDEFEEKFTDNPFLKSLVKRAGFDCYALSDFFENLEDFPFADRAQDVFILKEDPATCARMRAEQGVFIVSDHNLKEADIYSTRFEKSLYKDDISQSTYSDGTTCMGWTSLLQPLCIKPLNALIINDNYLFDDTNKGIENIIALLKAILPKDLAAAFHIIIVTYNKLQQNGKYPIDSTVAESIVSDIQDGLTSFTYPVEISLLTHKRKDEFHKRLIISNYHRIKSEHGFAAYSGSRVTMATDFDTHSHYLNILASNCDLALKDTVNFIKLVKRQHQSNLNAGNLSTIPSDILVGHTNHRLLQ